MSDTPRTDAMTAKHNDGIPSDFARDLERECSEIHGIALSLRALAVEQMIYCYDEANRLSNHGHGGHDRMATENLYAIANKARTELGLEGVDRKDWK